MVTFRSPSSDSDPLDHGEDLTLVRAVLDGDAAARRHFVERMGLVRRVLARRNARLGRPFAEADFEDLVQDALFAVWRKLATYAGRGPLDAFAYRVSVLEMASRLRRQRRLPGSLDTSALQGPEDGESELANRELVERCLDRLGSPDADVLRLKHLQGLTFEEVADLTGDSINTIKSRHYRGLTKLRSMLGLGAVAS